MGITNNCVKFLAYSHQSGIDFKKTVMLGRQRLYADFNFVNRILSKVEINVLLKTNEEFAESLFQALGAMEVDSLDLSDFEGANIQHDLNTPIPEKLKGQYSAVFDGGTLEHVFNYPMAIQNCMNMLEQGGHLISITPANNQCGHGFYQFSPELYYSMEHFTRCLKVKAMFLAVFENGGIKEWFEVMDPMKAKSRVAVVNNRPTYMMVVIEKTDEFSMGTTYPYQTDYNEAWSSFEDSEPEGISNLKKGIRLLVPEFIRNIVYKIRSRKNLKTVNGLGKVDPAHFTRRKPEDYFQHNYD